MSGRITAPNVARMLTLMHDLPPNVVGARAGEKVTSEDYEDVLVPAVETAGRSRDGWAIPGEIKVFDSDDLDAARRWITG
jgi:hypothetical protein